MPVWGQPAQVPSRSHGTGICKPLQVSTAASQKLPCPARPRPNAQPAPRHRIAQHPTHTGVPSSNAPTTPDSPIPLHPPPTRTTITPPPPPPHPHRTPLTPPPGPRQIPSCPHAAEIPNPPPPHPPTAASQSLPC